MALLNMRDFIGIDISSDYIEIARQRLHDSGLDASVSDSLPGAYSQLHR